MRGDEHLGHASGIDEIESFGDRYAVRGRHRCQLGLSTAADEREHAVADRRFGDAGAVRDHGAGELEPRDVGGHSRRRGVEAGALREVGAVQTGPVDADDDLTRRGLRIGAILDDNLAFADDECAHGRRVAFGS